MIKTVSDLLKAFADEERKKLDAEQLSHGPTIGSMYEGLTKEVLDRSLPPELGLKVVSGFATFNGKYSGELDCMLVCGDGDEIPRTGKYLYHVKNVIAVLEVKKTLTAADLADSHDHLRGVAQLHSSYAESTEAQDDEIDLTWPRRIFTRMSGIAAPDHADVDKLPFDLEMLYHTLVMEHLGPVRIVVGHHGWKKEVTLREHLLKLLEERVASNPAGMGAGSFPQLIVGGEYSIVKTNGIPYVTRIVDGFWPLLLSSSHNPLRILLELIYSKIDMRYDTGLAVDEGADQEAMSLCLSARAVQSGGQAGWQYKFNDLSSKSLKKRGPDSRWAPRELTSAQFVIVNRLCQDGSVSTDNPSFLEFVASQPDSVEAFVDSLIDTGLVARKDRELILTTDQCQTLITPGGKYVAGENNAGQMTNWALQEFVSGKKTSD